MELKSVYVVLYENRHYATTYEHPGDYDTVEAYVAAVFASEEEAYSYVSSELAYAYAELTKEQHEDVHIADEFIYYDGNEASGYTIDEFMVLKKWYGEPKEEQ